ncbi:hypothetical protein BJX62DRAFT_220783 [Aspergillus germanicus]
MCSSQLPSLLLSLSLSSFLAYSLVRIALMSPAPIPSLVRRYSWNVFQVRATLGNKEWRAGARIV